MILFKIQELFMLRYSETYSKSFRKIMGTKQVFVFAAVFCIPFLIASIISVFLLGGFRSEINNVIDNLRSNGGFEEILKKIEEVYAKYTAEIAVNYAVVLLSDIVGIILCMPAISSATRIVNGEETNIKYEYSQTFGYLKLYLLYFVKVLAWSLLFIIPGIIKAYSYSMCFAIKNECPDKKCIDCIKESKTLMKGRKERLFLQSIIYGLWMLLYLLAVGIAVLIIELIPTIGGIISQVISSFVSFLTSAIWFGVLSVFYLEIKKDEKFIEENPELKEKGINGVLRTEIKPYVVPKYYVRTVQSPYVNDQSPEQKQDIFEEAEKESLNFETKTVENTGKTEEKDE